MANVAILYCKKIQDHSCIACAKCHKAIDERQGEFARYADDEIHLFGMTDCGDCPGLTVPRVKLLREVAANLGRSIDVIHLGTCMKVAMETSGCPIDFDELQVHLQQSFGCEVVLGTHSY
jgi:predicted metal-binding protein